MVEKLTDTIVKALPVPASGNRIAYDLDVKGFGCRVTSAGARAFILNYRTRSGKERRLTIGQYPDWKTAAARDEAKNLKREIDRGDDPLATVEAERAAKTISDLATRFREEHFAKIRPATARGYDILLNKHVLPAIRAKRVNEISYSDVDGIHRKMTLKGIPTEANRTVALLSKMFSLAIKWGWRTDNPAKGIQRNPEVKRHRYLSAAEISRLGTALDALADRQAATIIRLLLLTGARSGELMASRWDAIDLEAGVWTKPGSTTKQKTMHRVPLSGPALELFAGVKREGATGDFVFPGRRVAHRVEIKYAWADACEAAGIANARIHDLRHTYASLLASANMSLPIIGALLGHSQPSTTARYAHLFDDPLRAATERAGALVGGAK
ncbi:MAG: tyrosine-type recombinase/integrase [Devosia sp.]